MRHRLALKDRPPIIFEEGRKIRKKGGREGGRELQALLVVVVVLVWLVLILTVVGVVVVVVVLAFGRCRITGDHSK